MRGRKRCLLRDEEELREEDQAELHGARGHGEATRGDASSGPGAGANKAGERDGRGHDDDEDGVPRHLVRQPGHWLPVQETSRSFWFVLDRIHICQLWNDPPSFMWFYPTHASFGWILV